MMPKLCLAPLHGVTNRVYREAYFKYFVGFDSVMAPFIHAITGADPAQAHFKDVVPRESLCVPVEPQLMGNDADSFIETASMLAGQGYSTVNINMGCPYPMVTRKRRGAGFLPHPDSVESFLDAACSRTTMRISVKVRLGLSSSDDILRIMPVLNKFPLERVIIHPRIATQMYSGAVNLNGFAAAAALSKHEIEYNGDIKDAAFLVALQARFPSIHRWMIGRGAMVNPFLPARLKGLPDPDDPAGTIQAFHEELYAGYRNVLFGPRHVLDKMKEVCGYLARSFSNCDSTLKSITRAKTLDAYERSVQNMFARERWQG
jgi:tRNA-dihydrouridine synthase